MFFRSNAKKCADSLGLTGWVRNLPDGSVEAEFEGDEDKVNSAIDGCVSRQPYARVDSKKVDMLDATGEYQDFTIRYD